MHLNLPSRFVDLREVLAEGTDLIHVEIHVGGVLSAM